MDAAVKERWVKALPEYKQGRGKLYDGEKFCCLGVLCDIELDAEWDYIDMFAVKGSSHIKAWTVQDPDSSLSPVSGCLPVYFRESVGITRNQEEELVNMNDTGKSFKQIAAWIEKNL